MTTVSERLADVKDRVEEAARRSGRQPGDVTLIAVSKSFPAESIVEAVAAGITDFGENKAQEFAEKVDFLSEYKSIRWHFIGHLQRNKTRLIVGRSDLFHGLDSVRLARSIESAAGGTGKPVDCLVQINVSAEDTKFGITPTELPALADVLSRIEDIRIRGLMTLAAPDLKEDALRQQFQRLRKLRDSMVSRGFVEASMLSMGMSSDFEIAIEEGATHVRIGSAIFGSRSLVRPD